MRTSLEQGEHLRARSRRVDSLVWIENISPIWSPMVRSGLSAVIGSWKIMAMPAPRTSRISAVVGAREVAAFEQDPAASM